MHLLPPESHLQHLLPPEVDLTRRSHFRNLPPLSFKSLYGKSSFHKLSATRPLAAGAGRPRLPTTLPQFLPPSSWRKVLILLTPPRSNIRLDLKLPTVRISSRASIQIEQRLLPIAGIFRFLRTCGQLRSSMSPRLRGSSTSRQVPAFSPGWLTRVSRHFHSLRPRRWLCQFYL